MAFYVHPGQTPAQAVRLLVEATIYVAMDVAYRRATEPESFPIVPATGVAEWYARRLLGDLLDAGFTPEGWETAYIEDAPRWVDPWSRESAD